MSKVYYKIESKYSNYSKSNEWVSAWSTEFKTLEAAVEVLFEYLVNRCNSGNDCSHYQIVKVTVESVINTENAVKKKLTELT